MILSVEFYNNRPKTQIVIVDVSKFAENFTKNNSKYIMKCVILSLKKQSLFGLLTRFLRKLLQLISVKTHKMKKNQTHRYSLKNKKLNMQICQFWYVVDFFCAKN
jgi:hypothetical protein